MSIWINQISSVQCPHVAGGYQIEQYSSSTFEFTSQDGNTWNKILSFISVFTVYFLMALFAFHLFLFFIEMRS